MSEIESETSVTNPLPLALADLQKSFDKTSVLTGASLSLQPGSITGLLGRNAAGKTTLIRTAVGLLKPDRGSAHLFGTPAFDCPAEIRQRIGYVSQSFTDLAFLRVSEAIGLIGSFYNQWDTHLVEKFRREWDVPENASIGKLSHGQQQKVNILLAIGHRPELLILDEPVASLDPAARHDFLRALLMLNDEINQTILFSSHITTDIERVAADIAILHKGQISYHGGLDELKEKVQCLFVRPKNRNGQLNGNLPQESLPQLYELDGFISSRIDGQRIQVWVTDWDEEKHAQLAENIGAPVHVESVGLEELFMGMTS